MVGFQGATGGSNVRPDNLHVVNRPRFGGEILQLCKGQLGSSAEQVPAEHHGAHGGHAGWEDL